jgi:hypothetical protein
MKKCTSWSCFGRFNIKKSEHALRKPTRKKMQGMDYSQAQQQSADEIQKNASGGTAGCATPSPWNCRAEGD